MQNESVGNFEDDEETFGDIYDWGEQVSLNLQERHCGYSRPSNVFCRLVLEHFR